MRNGTKTDETKKKEADGLRREVDSLFTPDQLGQSIEPISPVKPDDEDKARQPRPL